MDWNRFRRGPFFLPTLIALLLHLCVVAIAMWLRLPGQFEKEVAQEDMLRFNVKAVDTSPLLMKRDATATNPNRLEDSLRFYKKSGKSEATLPMDVPVQALMEKESSPQSTVSDVAPKQMDLQETDVDISKDMQAILVKSEENQLRDVVQVQPKETEGFSDALKQAEQQKTKATELLQSLTAPLQKMNLAASENVYVDPDEGMPGFTPMQGSFGNADMDQGVQESKGDILKYESIDDFLDIQVFTYEDPFDKQKYYMIKIYAKKGAKALKVMPKEILFAIDCSLSISPERLDEFKRGISYCLANLNSDDLFNIIAFRDKAILFSPKSVKATADVIKQAEKFVSELSSNRTTDVYGAFEKIVKAPLERNPSNIVLISDGRPTHGVVNSRELINSISKLNNNVRPIFAYSGGSKVNRYLLDFISYQNRAWSQFIKDRGKIHKGLGDFYAKIKDPVFLNLRYQLNGLGTEEVFPKTLPDFYKNAEFTLYGKYSTEDQFSMQLLGDIDGKTKELIFSRSLNEAVKGGPDIMKGYAFNKIYHLISQMTGSGQNNQTLKEIQDLSTRYKVTTPYSADLESQDG